MNIALDFDKTFTLAPLLWTKFIRAFEQAGHKVFIVTARDEHNDGINWCAAYGGFPNQVNPTREPVIWCDGCPKTIIVAERGIEIDVWIDDNPATIYGPTALAVHPDGPALLKEWREQDNFRGASVEPTGESRGFAYKETINGTPSNGR